MSEPRSDRNLLIGILAVQLDFVSRDQLVESMMDWVSDKSKSIDQVLFEKGMIDGETRELILGLVEKHLAKHEGNAQQSLAAISSIDSSLKQQLCSINDSEVEASLNAVTDRNQSNVTDVSAIGFGSTLEFSSSSKSGRYRVIRPHARGGLGEVHVAFDNELHREVALKEILDQHADHPDSRARFLAEAEVTGGLEHPGIVPVYGLGTYDNGRPFYAMRFIKGDSLKTAADHFHADRNQKRKRRDFQSVAFRELLGRFIDVCHAIEYAHSRGVLHRDLKPGNIMVGKYGETLVVDWGLSKVIGRPDVPAVKDETTLRPSSASGSAPTQMGSALGTPQYMPPEQAAGRLDQLGPESDVYSLGATLYYLLVGKPPFEKPNEEIGELLNDVQKGNFQTPAEVNSQVPPELNAICVKAMAVAANDRFGSANELCDELEKWMADEPVSSYAEPLTSRLGRWIRRNQVSVVAVTIFLASVAVGLTIISSLIAANNSVLSQKNSEIESQATELDRVNGNLSQANTQLQEAFTNEQQLREESEARRVLAETRLAETLIEKGANLCENNRPAEGLHWLVRALEVVPESNRDIQEAIRFSLAYWQSKSLTLENMFGHSGQVTLVEASQDSSILLTASFDRTARLWSMESGEPVGPPLKGTHQIEAAALLKDKRTVVVGCYDGVIRIYDGISGDLKGEGDAGSLVRQVSLSHDEKFGVARTNAKGLFFFDPTTGKELDALKVDAADIACSDFHPTKNQFMYGQFKEKKFALFDLEKSAVIQQVELEDSPRFIKYSPDGDSVVVVAGRPRIYDSDSLEAVTPDLPQNGVQRVDFESSGKKFVTAGLDGQSMVFSCPQGKLLANPLVHSGQVFDARISADGKVVATSSMGVAQLWDATTGRKMGQRLLNSGRVQFTPDNKRVICASFGGPVRVWTLVSPLMRRKQLDVNGFPLALRYSRESGRLVCVGHGNEAVGWDLETIDNTPSANEPVKPFVQVSAEKAIFSTAIRRNGAFAIGGSDKSIRMFDQKGQPVEHSPMGHDSTVRSMEYSPDDSVLISAGDDSILAFWEAAKGTLVGEPIPLDSPAHEMAVAKGINGNDFVVVGGTSQVAHVFDIKSHKELFELKHSDKTRITQLNVSSSGRWIVTGDTRGQVILWNSADGTIIWKLQAAERGFTVLKFSADDSLLLAGGYDKKSIVIETETGQSLGWSVRNDSQVDSGCFVLGDRMVLLGEENGISRLVHARTGLQIGAKERHRGYVLQTLALDQNRFLNGHASFRVVELRNAPDAVDGLRDRIALLTGTALDDDGLLNVLDEEQYKKLLDRVSKGPVSASDYFRQNSPELDANSERTNRELWELTNPIGQEKGRYGKTYTSYPIPSRTKSKSNKSENKK